jgi:hypothetical protein
VSYAPPAGSVLPFKFAGSAYTPPDGDDIVADFATQPSVAHVAPAGAAGAFGTAAVVNESPSIAPSGIAAGACGTPTATLEDRQVITQWVMGNQFGAVTVSNNVTVAASGIAAGNAGTPFSVVIGHYPPPSGTLTFEFVGSYAPPLGSALPFDFANTYTFTQIVPSGIAAGGLGSALVYNSDQHVGPGGSDTSAFGIATVFNNARVVSAFGLPSGDLGTAVVDLLTKYVSFSGIAPGGFGDAAVHNARLLVFDAGGFDAAAYGDTRVEHFERTIVAGTAGAGETGTPTVWFRVREVAPGETFFDPPWSQFGTAVVSDGEQDVLPSGIPEGDFGLATAARNERFVSPTGIVGEFPTPDVQLRTRFVLARDVPALTEWGFGQVYNSDQHVRQLYNEAFDLLDHGMGEPDLVENRNRTVGAIGFERSRVSNGAEVLNDARVLQPSGDDVSAVGTQFVAFRVRTIYAHGDDTSYFERWHAVHNSTSVVEPSGIPRDHPGIPHVFDNTQYIDPAGGNDLTLWGTAFAAYRIRTVDVAPWGIEADDVSPNPYVGLYERTVEAEGFEGGCGTPTLEHHRNIVATHGSTFVEFGELAARNVTPQLFAGSMDYPVPGRPTVDFRVKYVGPEGFDATLWYRPYVGPRTRTLVVNGPETLRIPTHRVRFDAPEIPAQQFVVAPSYPSVNFGFGVPAIEMRGARAVGWDSLLFGNLKVHANSIFPESIHPDFDSMFGLARLNPAQFVFPVWREEHIPPFPQPRISPTTIWISEPPPPLIRKPFSIVDEAIGSTYPSWGVPSVTHHTRYLQVSHDNLSKADGELMDEPFVAPRVRYVRPDGIAPRRFGVPMLPSGQAITPFWGRDTEDWIEGGDYDTALYGEVVVSPPPVFDPYVSPAGEAHTAFGATQVDLFNRTIYPASWYSNIFTGDNWVHPPIVLYPVGSDMAVFGATWASNRVRTIFPEGYLATKFEFTGDWNYTRMTVRNNWGLLVPGIGPGASPAPVVTLPDLGAVVTLGETLLMGRPRVGECAC